MQICAPVVDGVLMVNCDYAAILTRGTAHAGKKALMVGIAQTFMGVSITEREKPELSTKLDDVADEIAEKIDHPGALRCRLARARKRTSEQNRRRCRRKHPRERSHWRAW